MDYDTARRYLLDQPEAFEDYPFGPQVAVFKVRDKMFATLSINDIGLNRSHPADNRTAEQASDAKRPQAHMNLKCDPDEANALRDIFPAVIPGYHMNKKHWNTVILDGSIPVSQIELMIDRSYGLVVQGLKKAQRQSLELQYGPDRLYR